MAAGVAGAVLCSHPLGLVAGTRRGWPGGFALHLQSMALFRHCLVSALLASIFLVPILLYFEGGGHGHFTSYNDTYHGSMAPVQYRVALRPLPQPPAPAPAPTFATLRYGFNLAHHAGLPARVLESEIPAADLGLVLYDTTQFARFSPDSVYYAWVGLRGNCIGFALGARPAFVVERYQAVPAATTAVPHYAVQTGWHRPLLLYAWCCLTASFWLVAAGTAVLRVPMYAGRADRLAGFGLVLLFCLAVGYIAWVDYRTLGDWPIFTPFVALALLLTYGYQIRQPPESEDDDAEEAGAAPVPQ